MDKLFDLPEAQEREVRIAGAKWGGQRSTRARKICRAMLPHACRKCGEVINRDDPESSWDAGHREDRADGGTDDGIEPEHAHCNRSAGGKRGAAVTNGMKQQAPGATVPQDREREPQWW